MSVSLADALRCLSTQAADSLVDCLRVKGCIPAARLSCRALRACVDGSVQSLETTLRAGDRQRWEAGQLPSLALWPRCRSVGVTLDARGRNDVTRLALLPFAGQEPAALQRIEALALRTPAFGMCATNGEQLVCALVQQLPGLRALDFLLPECMSYDPLQQQLMHDALAAMPRLARLVLPSGRTLDRVGTLAASISLRILCINLWSSRRDEPLLSDAAAAGLKRL
ncbi:hypothetical protein TSOC_001144 [Tetrabaena socialis]|uniref:Uncharacterized protein n=1 Tax=Tetrabaena socialis TaxID=47790 RepID=A0A2J8AHH1_9CHLO|nr:hypothetical protein TSOC_001144 [Tetrabaena socialis]|eukprot:PNH11962.1 hypothetical protein TSOC_001144 [Tetrabaena socialis]